MKTLKNSLMLVVLMAGLNNRVSAQYNDNDNDNDTEVKVDKGKGKDDGDQSKRLEVIQKSTPMNPNNPYGQVERSKNGMIQAQGNQIIQDFKVIGTFNQFKQATNGTIQNEITFYLPNGTMIARCTGFTIESSSRPSKSSKRRCLARNAMRTVVR
jgi:hypothetical protein